ncbi:MAG: hypothetical protein WC721_22315 [Victivallaceae bacterium]
MKGIMLNDTPKCRSRRSQMAQSIHSTREGQITRTVECNWRPKCPTIQTEIIDGMPNYRLPAKTAFAVIGIVFIKRDCACTADFYRVAGCRRDSSI